MEEAGKYDPPGSTHCRYLHKCTETHIHKTQTQKVKCDLPGSMHCSMYALKKHAGSDVFSMKECCNHQCALQCLKIAALSTLQSFSSEPATTFLLLCPILLSEMAVGLVLVRCDNNFNVMAK